MKLAGSPVNTEKASALFVTLTGSRGALIANVCALVVASVLAAEGAYIENAVLGHYLRQDAWGFFFPALVMFIVRNRKFSCCVLALYVLLSIQMSFQARNIYLGTYVETDPKFGPLSFLPFLFVLSEICLMIYLAVALVRLAIAKLGSTNN
jgi:hypothetical protein